MQQTWALCTWAQIITKKEKKERKKNASHKHIILKILILFVPDETVVDSNLQNCSKCVFSCCSKCVFAARVLLCADVTFQQVAKTQERRQRISGDVSEREPHHRVREQHRNDAMRRKCRGIASAASSSFQKNQTPIFPFHQANAAVSEDFLPSSSRNFTATRLAINDWLTHAKHLPIVRAFLKRRSASVMVVASSSARST